MSIRVMTAIWGTCLYQGGTLNVLLAMADNASCDDGSGIYPGIEYLAAKCRQSPRATQDCIKRLRVDGVVKQVGPDGEDLPADENARGGRGHKTEYRIDLERVQELQALHEVERPGCEICRQHRISEAKRVKRAAAKGEVSSGKGELSWRKGEVSRSHIEEPSKEPSKEPSEEPPAPKGAEGSQPTAGSTLFGDQASKDRNGYEIPAWVPIEAWNGFVEMRKRIRKPLTDRAKELALKKLTKLRAEGHEPGVVLDQSTLHSWQDLYPSKDEKQAGAQYDNRSSSPAGRVGSGSAPGRLDRIAQAAATAMAAGTRSQ